MTHGCKYIEKKCLIGKKWFLINEMRFWNVINSNAVQWKLIFVWFHFCKTFHGAINNNNIQKNHITHQLVEVCDDHLIYVDSLTGDQFVNFSFVLCLSFQNGVLLNVPSLQ